MTKILIYQVLPRLFGNTKHTNIPNGDISTNGCGKLNDFSIKILKSIKKEGYSHIWYTGIIEHATMSDYTKYGIKCDNKIVVKGKAGSPYAIKDYYDIDPDLASDVENRMNEFSALIERTHQAKLKMIIDFVPNHVARQYHSDAKPNGIKDLGEDDDTNVMFKTDNNFYYLPKQELTLNFNRESNQTYSENPAKVTGNNRFDASVSVNDWYETVKLNYGVDYCNGHTTHFSQIPNTWNKMLNILLFWCSKGIDGFRCDMAEMVPCEFWSWAITKVKEKYKDIIFIAEVYNPNLYRDYIQRGHFDYLYDKVGLYDKLRSIICGYALASEITYSWQSINDIQSHMLNFLENHDEQRIASDYFAGSACKAKPALIVSALMNSNPFMIYAGQEIGEKGMDKEGFSGLDGRTSIFDYWTVSSLATLFANTPAISKEQLNLKKFYQTILRICSKEKAIEGQFFDLMYVNNHSPKFNAKYIYTFLRKKDNELIWVVTNFSKSQIESEIVIPKHAFEFLNITPNKYKSKELLTKKICDLELKPDEAIQIKVEAYNALIFKIIL